MKINIPRVLDLDNTLSFCDKLKADPKEKEYIYDYKNMEKVEPFGLLLLSSKIRRFVNSLPNCEHKDCNFKNDNNASGYAAHMGFFKSVYQDYGKEPGEAPGSSTYIPLTELNFDDVRRDGEDLYYYINKTSEAIANILARRDNNLSEYLKYCISELVRNVLEHSESESFWYAGQYWPSKGIVEVAVLDEGIGMKNSFLKNKKLSVDNDEEAIKLSVEPGISRSGIGREARYEYDNSGFGLYMITNLCKMGGDIAICSGNTCLLINDKTCINYKTSFGGTAIRLRLNSCKMGNKSDIMKTLAVKGTKYAKKYKKMNNIGVRDII